MNYLVIYSDGYDTSVTDFETRVDADAYLASHLSHLDDDDSMFDYYRLIAYTQEFEVLRAVRCYEAEIQAMREQALSKLTQEEKVLLGLARA